MKKKLRSQKRIEEAYERINTVKMKKSIRPSIKPLENPQIYSTISSQSVVMPPHMMKVTK
jgi:hypothetical protein